MRETSLGFRGARLASAGRVRLKLPLKMVAAWRPALIIDLRQRIEALSDFPSTPIGLSKRLGDLHERCNLWR